MTTPLGVLSSHELEEGSKILTQIERQLQLRQPSGLVELSNHYYTLIPHSFGRERPPVIDNEDILNKEKETLERLMSEPKEFIWQFDSRHGWFDFTPAASKELEEHYEHYQKTGSPQAVSVTSGQWKYLINFSAMTQANTEHPNHRIRSIRRVLSHESNPPTSF